MSRLLIVLLLCLVVVAPVEARRRPRRPLEMGQRATGTLEQHYEAGKTALEAQDWRMAARHMHVVATEFEGQPLAAEGHFWKGVAYYEMGEWRRAHNCFADYFKRDASPRYFEEVCCYRLDMANRLREGEKEHLFGVKQMPRWSKARELVLELYDEVCMAMPSSEPGAEAFYGKGQVLWEMQEYALAIQSFQTLINRFPRHKNSPRAYVAIMHLYRDHCKDQPHNPDLLPLAQVAMRKFRHDFPSNERLEEAEGVIDEMREILAEALVDTGRFFERAGKPPAACVYYRSAALEYGETDAAGFSVERLAALGEPLREVMPSELPVETLAEADLGE